MKALHRDDLFGWSEFDLARNLDFHSVFWARDGAAGGNVAIDPLPLSAHDRAHVEELGGVGTIVVTNSDHTRAAAEIARWSGATICGPAGERADFPIDCQRWLADGDQVVAGLVAMAVTGSKTSGEVVLLLEQSTLITGDFVRAHRAGELCLLPDAKLSDAGAAGASLRRLQALPEIEAVLVGDGWPVFRNGAGALGAIALP